MAVTPTPGQWEYLCDNRTDICALYVAGELYLGEWMWIFPVLVASVGLVGNSTVLWLLGFRIQRNAFSVFILNLAAADTLFLCCAFLFCLTQLVNYLFTHVTCSVFLFLSYTFYTVGLSLLAGISTERCLSVLFPIWYLCHRPKHTSEAVCAVLWALGIMLWLFFALFNYLDVFGRVSCYLGPLVLVVCLTLLTCVLCMSSLTLLLRVQCSSQRQQPPRLYLLVLLTVLVFLLCGLIPGTELTLWFFKIHFMPFWIPWLLACVNSSANPLIYFFLGSQKYKRRKPLRVLLQRALADDQEMGRESGDIPCTQTLKTSSRG